MSRQAGGGSGGCAPPEIQVINSSYKEEQHLRNEHNFSFSYLFGLPPPPPALLVLVRSLSRRVSLCLSVSLLPPFPPTAGAAPSPIITDPPTSSSRRGLDFTCKCFRLICKTDVFFVPII